MKRTPFLALLYCLGALATDAAADMPFFAMDTGTRDAAHRTAEAQVAMVEEIGFDGIGPTYTNPESLREWLDAVKRHESKLFAIYLRLDLDTADPVSAPIRDAISQLRGHDSIIWLHVVTSEHKPSDPAGDARAVAALRRIAALAEPAGVKVALYPHAGMWLERIEDATRIARAVNRPGIGVTFNLCHWLKVDGTDIEARLKEALPHLFAVTINGADAGAKDWRNLIQPLDSGNFDVGELLAKLAELKWRGPIGLQHYGIKGDARANLKRSLDAWRKMQIQNTK